MEHHRILTRLGDMMSTGAMVVALGITPVVSATPTQVPLPRPRPVHMSVPAAPKPPPPRRDASFTPPVASAPLRPNIPFVATGSADTPSADLALVKQALDAVRTGKISQAKDTVRAISDPVAHKVVEWAILRNDDTDADFAQYTAFAAANPSWPSLAMFRRRAEAALWQENQPSQVVRAFFRTEAPLSPKGRFALARALLADGDRAGATPFVREAWRQDAFSRDLEQQALDTFGEILTAADFKARMDVRLYAEDTDAAMRAAERAGGAAPAIAKARIAVIQKSSKAQAWLDAVPREARRDAGYIFSAIQQLRRTDEIAAAAQMMLNAPRDPNEIRDSDQWWIERRLIARKLLDDGEAQTAYRLVREATTPAKENYQVEQQFMAGWIALQFLHAPSEAAPHFARIIRAADTPHALARGNYWLGRTAEALGRREEAHAYYEAGARFPTTYYGQLARAKFGHQDIGLKPPPDPGPEHRAAAARLEVVRAVEILYAVDARSLVIPFTLDLAQHSQDGAALAAMAEICARYRDARAMLLLGKEALAHGYAFEHYAFPTLGIPDYRPVGPAVEPSVVYAIARQESTFNQQTISSAKAYGLMQVTPDAGRYVAKRHGAPFDVKRLLSDASYNVQMGAAELGGLIEDYNGSYIMAFAGYNAGRTRVKQWIAAYGDPRDRNVDPIDWVERIPFSETRNYVERVMENLQVYRMRFGGGSRLMIEADLRRGGTSN